PSRQHECTRNHWPWNSPRRRVSVEGSVGPRWFHSEGGLRSGPVERKVAQVVGRRGLVKVRRQSSLVLPSPSVRLKILRPQGHVGSSPTPGTLFQPPTSDNQLLPGGQ